MNMGYMKGRQQEHAWRSKLSYVRMTESWKEEIRPLIVQNIINILYKLLIPINKLYTSMVIVPIP